MNKLQYYNPNNSELPDGYSVKRKCLNCKHKANGCCIYDSPWPDITTPVDEYLAWVGKRTVDPDGWCPQHKYYTEE